MAVDLGSTFKELIDEINSKSSVDSIDGLKGGTLSSPLTFTGGDGTNAKKAILDNTNNGQITDKSTGTLLGFIGSDFVVGSNSYLTKIRGNASSTIGGKKFSDLATKDELPDNFVTTDTEQTITAVKTFNAPTNVSGKETITTKFKTSNGGAVIIGKEGPNSGTMLRFDQVDGTCRLRFRGSATAGAMVWEQPEKNAALFFDMGNSAGSGTNRVTLRNVAGTLALTKELPAAVSANPTLTGSEAKLTSLQIGSTKYKIPSGGSCVLNDLEADYTEDVNAVPVLDVEETGNWIMVPVSELGGGGKKYYNHYISLPVYDSSGNRTKNVQFNIVSTDNTAFTKSTLYLHLYNYQLCVVTTYNPTTLVTTDYAGYFAYVSSTQLIVCIMSGVSANVISFSSSNLAVTDSVTLISDL